MARKFPTISGYHKTTKTMIAEINAIITPYEIRGRETNSSQFALFLGDEKLSGWANRGLTIDKAIAIYEAN